MTGRMSEYTQEERRERKREEGMDGSREGERESEKREGEGGRRASSSGNPTAAPASVSSEIVFAPSWLVLFWRLTADPAWLSHTEYCCPLSSYGPRVRQNLSTNPLS